MPVLTLLIDSVRFLFQKDEKKNEGEKKVTEAKNQGEKKTADGGGKKDDAQSPIVLKLDLHCEGCAKKVKRSIKHFDGMNTFFLFLSVLLKQKFSPFISIFWVYDVLPYMAWTAIF